MNDPVGDRGVTTTPGRHLRRMSGRDPHEDHRVATPLELLFDLTFVIAVGVAASQLAHLLATGAIRAGVIGFALSTFAVCWAWINFSWFASAYDTDDWVYRLTTMIQMVGVVVLALGIPTAFKSIEHGGYVDNRIMVAGYIVMRVAMVFQWLRAARGDPRHRRACLTYAAAILVAQVGWVAAMVLHTSVPVTALVYLMLICVEMLGPYLAERRGGGTPWHAHHIAERYSLFAIIALGEGVVGTVASLSAVVTEAGWTVDAALVTVAGIGLTFGMWWVYFVFPMGPALHAHRERSFAFGYGHIVLYGAIVATGAGLHMAAYFIEHESALDSTQTVLTLAIPVGVYLACVVGLSASMTRRPGGFPALMLVLGAVVLTASALLASAGVPMAVCLLVVMLAPALVALGFEFVAHRRPGWSSPSAACCAAVTVPRKHIGDNRVGDPEHTGRLSQHGDESASGANPDR